MHHIWYIALLTLVFPFQVQSEQRDQRWGRCRGVHLRAERPVSHEVPTPERRVDVGFWTFRCFVCDQERKEKERISFLSDAFTNVRFKLGLSCQNAFF